jgi:hypothetical protein
MSLSSPLGPCLRDNRSRKWSSRRDGPRPHLEESAGDERVQIAITRQERAAALLREGGDDAVHRRADGPTSLAKGSEHFGGAKVDADSRGLEETQILEGAEDRRAPPRPPQALKDLGDDDPTRADLIFVAFQQARQLIRVRRLVTGQEVQTDVSTRTRN